MKLHALEIKNYRSIRYFNFQIPQLEDKSNTFGLIGVNEAGKSSILKALALKEGVIKATAQDFHDKSLPIEISYNYQLTYNDLLQILKSNLPDSEFKSILSKIKTLIIKHVFSIDYSKPSIVTNKIEILGNPFTEQKNVEGIFTNYLISKKMSSIFWTAEPKFLINTPINLSQFSINPDQISIPLKNCFLLAGITNIQDQIKALTDSTEKEYLQTSLGEKVTEHINKTWPNHPIKISFIISDGFIYFHVNDLHSNSRPKTAGQRSDGFKQFISFLLTISAQNKNGELNNVLLLLDEPETHLHPQAQEYLLEELISITKAGKNITVLFATHSNYMIDKKDLSRNFKVIKDKDISDYKPFNKKTSSYASVNYEVYNIASNDYHNELYGILQEQSEKTSEKNFEEFLVAKGLKKNNLYVKIKKDGTKESYEVTLPTKIRNIIHHPENPNNKFSQEELRKSIDLMIGILYK